MISRNMIAEHRVIASFQPFLSFISSVWGGGAGSKENTTPIRITFLPPVTFILK
jgi:hypothetical protein